MRLDPARLGIRHQLLGLFGAFLLTGFLVLAIDQVGQYYAQRTMAAMQDDVLAGMRNIRQLSNAYEQDVVDTTFRTRNYLISWSQAERVIARAQANSAKEWAALQAMPLDDESRALLQQALLVRPRADAAMANLRQILQQRDILALGRFADRDLYPSVDPLVQRLERIGARGQVRAAALVHAEQLRNVWIGRLRVGLSLLCLVLVVIFGRRILRNGYRGVESLTRLARGMAQHDYTAQPSYLPRGELGEVMDSFLGMREHVRRIEGQLNDQLSRNERVRVALERREQFQRLLLEAAQTAIFAVDDEGVFSQVNPFAEKLLGWPAGSLLGRETLDTILDPEALGALARGLSEAYGHTVLPDWTALRELARHREPPREFALRHKRGRTLPVLLALSAMRDAAGGAVGLLAVATDLTHLKRLERALRDSEARAREANHAKSAFLAAMSHEIRTPMIGVTGMIEVLGHTRLDGEQRRSLNIIQASAETLLRIIGDILDFSKIEAGKMELEPMPTALADLLRSVVANYAGSASSKGLALTCEIDPQLAPAHVADPVRLRQVIGNFLSNAIKFTERGGVVAAVDVVRHDPGDGALGSDALVLRVTDTGIGISARAQARLFQPFAQAEADTTRRFGGTGLGLAISRRIAELMGGSIEMDSTPGKGTSMRLQVTLQRAPENALPDRLSPGKQMPGFVPRRLPSVADAERERSLVLLVDDHATNRQVIQRQLALAGYASETAEDGMEGLQRWRSGRYALLLSDVHMPRLDGYQLARAIREEEGRAGLPRTPIVALTASALKGEAERCLAAGMDDYLTKPVSIASLGASLQRWLPHTAGDGGMSVEDGALLQVANNAQSTASETAPELGGGVDGAILDENILGPLTGNDPEQTRLLLEDFLGSTRSDLAELEHLREAGNLPELTRQAHKMKGAAKIVGAEQLATAAAALEAAGRSGDWSAVLPLATDIQTASARLLQHVARRFPG
ncbi:ATP-binding protein [Thermomonas paludicola]|uniref:ATP-binding protein n=1 Tax=Thermomonas paludicola TaxID=2884874 RepID=UPI002114B859|nr:ATP-binding protein [Thermomonas paludicola]